MRERIGREEITKAMAGLSRYEATMHLVGNHTVWFGDDPDRATGEAEDPIRVGKREAE